ncbi:hypothetical protein [Paradevosia shaoguanensis]|uniref:hypothetical protein n=1 Tax=Paradevosia shaoguanensis TaxID=1335043 RepID=UPI003C751C28
MTGKMLKLRDELLVPAEFAGNLEVCARFAAFNARIAYEEQLASGADVPQRSELLLHPNPVINARALVIFDSLGRRPEWVGNRREGANGAAPDVRIAGGLAHNGLDGRELHLPDEGVAVCPLCGQRGNEGRERGHDGQIAAGALVGETRVFDEVGHFRFPFKSLLIRVSGLFRKGRK